MTPSPQPPPHRSFYPIQKTACTRCGAEFVFCRLEMLNPFIEKSTTGLCHGCMFGESGAGMETMKITARMKHELALTLGGACG